MLLKKMRRSESSVWIILFGPMITKHSSFLWTEHVESVKSFAVALTTEARVINPYVRLNFRVKHSKIANF